MLTVFFCILNSAKIKANLILFLQKYTSKAKILISSNLIFGLCLIPTTVQAQNIIPAKDGTGTVVNNYGDNFYIRGGSLSNDKANLFHSFSKFGLDANQTANFLSHPSIQNILGRVTGGEASLINGVIRVTGGNSNLYLINPAGIIFGQNASLNVPASFTATTANRLGFGNDNWLNAVGTNNYSKLIGTPNSFAFDTNFAGAIFNQGNLVVKSGENLNLFAVTVASTGNLSAPGGRVTIAAVPGSSLLRLSMPDNPLSLEIQPLNSTNNNLAANSLAALLTGGGGGNATNLVVDNGEVKLTGSGLTINNGDVVSTGNISAHNAVTINAKGNVTTQNVTTADRFNAMAGGDFVSTGDIFALDSVTINAVGNIKTQNVVTADRFNAMAGGDFVSTGDIVALESVTINPIDNIKTQNVVTVDRFNAMAGGNVLSKGNISALDSVTINATGNITTQDISTADRVQGIAGSVSLIAGGNITTNNIDTSAFSMFENATGGAVNLTANSNITVGSINTSGMSTNNKIQIQGGDVNISANGTVRVVGEIFDGNQPTGNSIFTGALNQPGTVTIQHNGGVNNVPFVVGDASLNGTAAAINVSNRTISQISATSTVHTFPVLPLGGIAAGTPNRISLISVNTPPNLTVRDSLLNTQKNQAVRFDFSSLNSNINDVNNDNSRIIFDNLLSGYLTLQDGTPVTKGTTLNRNTVLTYTPPRDAVGQIPAFTIKASDGVSESGTQQININIPPLSISLPIPNNPSKVESQTNNSPASAPNNPINPSKNSLLTVDLNNFGNPEVDNLFTNVPRVEKDEYILEPQIEADIYKNISKIDDRFTDQFTQYLGTNKPAAKTIQESRNTLVNIENLTGVKPAIVYISFIPKNSKGNVLQGQRITPKGDDVLELLMLTGKGAPIRRVLENVTRAQVLAVSKTFTTSITNIGSTKNYMAPSKQLYKWLIAPLQYNLKARKINNLVFITDTGLRSLPMAALYDGQRYLIENYSIGLMPSFTLTDTNYVDIKKTEVLGMGASQFMNLDPLPSVPSELTTITQRLWLGRTFLNEAFTLRNLKAQRQQKAFGIVHLATHGEFNPGAASNSYIQLWDTQLRMDQIRQLGWNDPPVELVVLSACRTALGDEEAEFGFAGFAVQSGAKSALASLWTVSDEGTLGLMTQFYEKLKQAPIKAEALRQAQLAMLKGQVWLEMGRLRTARGEVPLPETLTELGDRMLTHPYFWSAFTMVGNPW